MLESMNLKAFTTFPRAEIRFGEGLNVFLGENGTGKTHLLKLAYAALMVSADSQRAFKGGSPTRSFLAKSTAEKLVGVFRPDSLGRLTKRKQGRERCEVRVQFKPAAANLSFSFASPSKTEVSVDRLPKSTIDKEPVYIPTRELLSIFPNFVSVYEGHYLEFEETYRDLCLQLGRPALRGPRLAKVRELIAPLEDCIGGRIVLERSGRFYLKVPGSGNMEIPLVAEGLRKLGMLCQLIANGSLLDKGFLFWDEPETNMNPKLIRLVAQAIFQMCEQGIQVFVATHSPFLLREFDLLARGNSFPNVPTRYFGLHATQQGVEICQGDTIDDIGDIGALDAELEQSDQFFKVEGGG